MSLRLRPALAPRSRDGTDGEVSYRPLLQLDQNTMKALILTVSVVQVRLECAYRFCICSPHMDAAAAAYSGC